MHASYIHTYTCVCVCVCARARARVGFSVNTFLGQREQDNTIQQGADVLEFFASRRLEPEIDLATRKNSGRAAKIPPRLLDEIGTKGFKVMQRLQESDVWRDLIFSPVREQGPRLLHGDLWLGNMARFVIKVLSYCLYLTNTPGHSLLRIFLSVRPVTQLDLRM